MKVTLNGQPCNLIVPVDSYRHAQEFEGVVVLYWWDGLATYGEVGGNPLSRRCLDDQGPTLGPGTWLSSAPEPQPPQASQCNR